jgi:hypothetical protein
VSSISVAAPGELLLREVDGEVERDVLDPHLVRPRIRMRIAHRDGRGLRGRCRRLRGGLRRLFVPAGGEEEQGEEQAFHGPGTVAQSVPGCRFSVVSDL